jgi:pimeloyl-ACP methyl ester carboxylesterase
MSPVATKSDVLKVPGATIYYEIRGSGPVLLFIPGGPADAASFRRIADVLAADHTVVTYDPRGLSHSPLEGPIDDHRIVEIFADDAHRLLSAVTKEPADVFGSSGGAVIALELVARHPEQVRTVVSHEPPSPVLLPDPAKARADMAEIVDTYRAAGIGPAMQKFMVQTGIRGGPPPPPPAEPTPEMREAMARMQRNMDFWLGHYFMAIATYEPDFDTLKKSRSRIVAGVGNESRGELPHEGGLALAKRLGTEAVVFPGAHGGFDSHVEEFAPRLREVLEG